jgi:hypothetical protein
MKRKISVSIFLAILVIILAWLYIKFNNETKPREDVITTENEISKEPSITISQEQISAAYYIKQESGRLVVYEGKSNAVYMETSIDMMTLSEKMIERIREGIYFQTESELFDFLESYSS